VAVDDQADAEQAVEEGRGRAGRDERGCGEWDEAGGEEALEGPVVRAVGLGHLDGGGKVVGSFAVPL